jgi:hypothetical protein
MTLEKLPIARLAVMCGGGGHWTYGCIGSHGFIFIVVICKGRDGLAGWMVVHNRQP